ncbi:MAG: M4 family metallopeptidase [Acidobacteria bacterium]|nr:M4 family metallopeptidase [Acidobacteriota bacterium]
MANRRLSLSVLATALVAAPLCAANGLQPMAAASLAQVRAQQSLRVADAQSHLLAMRGQFGLDADAGFAPTRALTDAFGQTHSRFNQTYRGVKVWGGEVIAHTDSEGQALAPTNVLKSHISLNTTPSISREEALAAAVGDLAPKGAFASEPQAELVIYPVQSQFEHSIPMQATLDDSASGRTQDLVLRYALAYHISTDLQNGVGETKQMNYMVDAHTGAILSKWNALRTADATGTANTQYSGTRSIHTDSTGSTYQMVDNYRAMHISTYNLNHGTGSGTGTIYTDSDNTWGDGANYVEGSSTTAANGETAATDAHYGIEVTYDFYKTIFGRNGIDNNNRATYSRVHYSNSYDNAFWSDSCFCMTYGDGSSFTTLTALDVAGHEMSHGVCANSAGLNYSGESGGLNESNSDILGNMVELFSKSGNTLPSSVANTDGCWMVGEQLSSTPLRYMYKPSLDGGSKDAWSSTLGNLDVHYSSGPNNRMFFFLSQGATTSGNYSTSYLPNGMTGVGPNHAAQIWYRALTVYLTASSNYAAARTACMSAASDLYGTGSAEYAAVQNAYHGINVGAAAPSGGDTTAPTATASESGTSGTITLSATASDNVGVTKVEFYVDGTLKGTDTSSPYSMTLDSTTLSNGSHSLVAKAYDAAGNVGSSSAVSFTVSNSTGGDTTAPTATASESGTSGTITLSATASDNVGVTKVEFYVDGSLKGTDTSSPYSMTLDSTTLSNGSHSLVAKAYDAAGNVGSSSAVSFTVSNSTGGTDLITNGGFESGSTGWTQTSGVIGQYGSSEPTHGGTYEAWLDGYGSSHTDTLSQSFTIPSNATSATLTFYLHVDTAETTTTTAYDKLTVKAKHGSTTTTLATFSNLNAASGYTLHSYNLLAYKGQTVTLTFSGKEDSSLQTSFVLDDVSVK